MAYKFTKEYLIKQLNDFTYNAGKPGTKEYNNYVDNINDIDTLRLLVTDRKFQWFHFGDPWGVYPPHPAMHYPGRAHKWWQRTMLSGMAALAKYYDAEELKEFLKTARFRHVEDNDPNYMKIGGMLYSANDESFIEQDWDRPEVQPENIYPDGSTPSEAEVEKLQESTLRKLIRNGYSKRQAQQIIEMVLSENAGPKAALKIAKRR